MCNARTRKHLEMLRSKQAIDEEYISILDLVKESGVNHSVIYRFIAGGTQMRSDKLQRVWDALLKLAK